jgi:hydroxymethylbilane synthase
MNKIIRIGTRESQLAEWQATLVQQLLQKNGVASELVFIKSEGDIDLQTPLYEIGVTGIFTRSLDVALINNKIDIAVHSMKDVPTQLANGIAQAAVLTRASYKDIFIYKNEEALAMMNGQWAMGGEVNSEWAMGNTSEEDDIMKEESSANKNLINDNNRTESENSSGPSPFTIHHSQKHHSQQTPFIIATSSIRRMAQWLHRYPGTIIENLRGNVNTRLRKVQENNWHGAIFAAAGLDRINLRPKNAIELNWMLPAPAQGAIMVVCREKDDFCLASCATLNDDDTATCVQIERDFLRTLLGGCSTPISALAQIKNGAIHFSGNILSPDGKQKAAIEKVIDFTNKTNAGKILGEEILRNGGDKIIAQLQHAK